MGKLKEFAKKIQEDWENNMENEIMVENAIEDTFNQDQKDIQDSELPRWMHS